ncbi:Uncharacterized protein Rs2_33403 [Raphanus sativus]|nr:Uncharacterized protein Rs2_33403 [Raphanus sativus]
MTRVSHLLRTGRGFCGLVCQTLIVTEKEYDRGERDEKRSVIASLMVVKDALESLRNLTYLALLSMMKNGEFLSMVTNKNVQLPGQPTMTTPDNPPVMVNIRIDFTHTEPLLSMSKKASACSRDNPNSSSERIRSRDKNFQRRPWSMHEYLTPPPYTTITACNVAQPLGKAVRGVRYHIPAAKRGQTKPS